MLSCWALCIILICIICTFSSFLFFFSSRRRHTRWPRDWSSDVCSSDLTKLIDTLRQAFVEELGFAPPQKYRTMVKRLVRSEERRVGKECRSRWWAYE